MADVRTKVQGGHVCPWWFAYTFDNFLRRLVHDPARLLAPYASPGMTVLDVGCGMGHFTIGLARLVGPQGRVHAVDLQQKMLDVTMGRASRAGVADRIVPHRCTEGSLGLDGGFRAGFALLFWMVHEVPEPRRLFREVHGHLTPGGLALCAEPSFHVGAGLYQEILAAALETGLAAVARPAVRFSRAVLLRRV